MSKRGSLCGIAVSVLISSISLAGPEWVEFVDAGALPPTAQKVTGHTEVILTIKGQLLPGDALDGTDGDHEDMYVIQIDEPTIFYASTSPDLKGQADFDTQLWLFKLDGSGLLGNDNTWSKGGPDGITPYSTIWNNSNDGTKIVITEPGMYLLAISTNATKPVSAGGDIFAFNSPTEVSGPDGAGGELPIIDWVDVPTGPPGEGADRRARPGALHYTISLAGVVPVPGISAGVDIDPGKCPNNYNRGSNGHLKVAILGAADLDVFDVNLASIRISRVDNVGGQASIHLPPQVKYKDISQPYEGGEECGCHSRAGDGVVDLEVKFKGSEMTQSLQLGAFAIGDSVPLTVTGELNDGTPFEAFDCIRITR